MRARQDFRGGRDLLSRSAAWFRRKTNRTPGPIEHRSAAPTEAQRREIRLAISEGRIKKAARLLEQTSPRWRRDPEAWQWVSDSAPAEAVIPVALRLSRAGHAGGYLFAAGILTRTDLEAAAPEQRRAVGRALIHGGQHEAAISFFERLVAGERDPGEDDPEEELRKDTHLLELAQFYLAANQHLGQFTSPTGVDVKGFVVVYNMHNQVLTGLMVPMAGLLMEKGYPVKMVIAGSVVTPRTGIGAFDRLEGCIAPGGSNFVGKPQELAHDWTIDWAAGVVEADGINYYTYFQERLARWADAYRTESIENPDVAEKFDELLRRSDVALSLCESVRDLAVEQGKPVRIAIQESHFAPRGIIREWCHQVGGKHGVHAVALSVGYENYYSNLTSLEATTLAVEDLTAQPTVRQPFLGSLHRLEAALAEDPALDADPDEQVLSWIVQDRSQVALSSPGRVDVVGRVERARAAGGKVFVALGKVTVDFAAPGDRGFAHADFVDWVNHLVQAVAGTENQLLIKPHPHELREEIVNEGVQPLRDLVVPDLPENVVFLDHDAFNTHELADIVDVAFLWNGTAILEFSVLGVPVVPASVWAERDYPIGFEVLGTREEYEQVLRGARVLSVSPGATRRAAAMLRLMRSEHVAIPYAYVRRATTNVDVRAPWLDVQMLQKLAETPDPYVERAASRFFEFE
jgi:hypothetical protein